MIPQHINITDAGKQQLVDYLNVLINDDFQKLVQLLYQADVNETTLKNLLARNQNLDAANVIADLLIKRELEKKETRKRFKSDNEISEDERW